MAKSVEDEEELRAVKRRDGKAWVSFRRFAFRGACGAWQGFGEGGGAAAEVPGGARPAASDSGESLNC